MLQRPQCFAVVESQTGILKGACVIQGGVSVDYRRYFLACRQNGDGTIVINAVFGPAFINWGDFSNFKVMWNSTL